MRSAGSLARQRATIASSAAGTAGALADARDRLAQRVLLDLGLDPTAVWHLAGDQLEEQDAERIDVNALVNPESPESARGPCSRACPASTRCASLLESLLLQQLGDAEVEQDDPAEIAIDGDHHVLGLDVAVHDPFAVGEANRVAQPAQDRERLGRARRPRSPANRGQRRAARATPWRSRAGQARAGRRRRAPGRCAGCAAG